MKLNLIIAMACILAGNSATAQTQKGTQTLGGSLFFSTRNTNGSSINSNAVLNPQQNNYTSFTIAPAYTFFVADKLELGGSVQFSTLKYKSVDIFNVQPTQINQRQTNIGATVSLLKYCMFDKLGLRMGPYIGYSRGKEKSAQLTAGSMSTTTNTNMFNAGARLDLVYYPSKTLGVAAALANLGYSKTKSNNSSIPLLNGSSENFNANFITNGLTLSVFYVFGNK